ncbi:MAG: putative membrane protein insertion efficiency factor [Arenicella sp.]|jgi:putative membrane protein insertion efficiency factor
MIVKLLQTLFKLYYLLVSPFLGNRCRYAPSCSEYANQALEMHGVSKGLWLTFKRLSRCHPWGGSGLDPVPTTEKPSKDDQVIR